MKRYRVRRTIGIVLVLLLATPLAALDLPRGALWRVEETCILNERTTGSPFPCLAVDLQGGFAVLRAPFRQTHIVVMPTARTTGIEDPRLRGPEGASIFAQAWDARHFVDSEVKHRLAWNDIGLAVNSVFTRSQDQLHIHVDCVAGRVKREIADRLSGLPTDAWQPAGYVFQGQSYWGRRLERADLAGVNPARLLDDIPVLHAHPDEATLAILGVTDAGGANGFVLLAGRSDPRQRAEQSTSEDMLDHHCRRAS